MLAMSAVRALPLGGARFFGPGKRGERRVGLGANTLEKRAEQLGGPVIVHDAGYMFNRT